MHHFPQAYALVFPFIIPVIFIFPPSCSAEYSIPSPHRREILTWKNNDDCLFQQLSTTGLPTFKQWFGMPTYNPSCLEDLQLHENAKERILRMLKEEIMMEKNFIAQELQEKKHVDQKQWQVLVVAHCAAVVVVVGAMVVGMHACAPALAADMTLCPEVASKESAGFFGDMGDIQSGFASAFLLIFFSEIGDKTFFIAALLATRKSNLAVFTGTFGALATMTVISVTLGRAFHYLDGVLPFSLGNMELPLDDLAAVVLLVYFGVSTLLEASSMDGSKAEEEQQEAELAIAGVGANGAQGLQAAAGTVAATFALVFVAEWGDKSFFSTIALAAASSPLGVVTGAIAGHGVATVLAVLGGSFLGTYISEKVIAYVGGALFLVFAAATLVEIVR
ncbi:unnamed protein product [Sphagnum compactum]